MVLIKIQVDNLQINYIKQGNGEKNVLILPGWGTTIQTYMPLINSLSTYTTVYCLDMPGFGESQEPSHGLSLDDYVHFVISFIHALGLKELDIIAHSNGGRITIKMLGKEPLDFKVHKIILMGSAGIVHPNSLSQKIHIKLFKIGKKILSLKPMKVLFPNLLEKLKNNSGSEDYRNASPIMKQTLVKLIHEDVREFLPKIEVPTLLLWGENDEATPIEDAKLMEKLIPDAGLVCLKNGSHYAFLEQARICAYYHSYVFNWR